MKSISIASSKCLTKLEARRVFKRDGLAFWLHVDGSGGTLFYRDRETGRPRRKTWRSVHLIHGR